MKIINILKACCGLLGAEPDNFDHPITDYKHAIKIALGNIPDEFYLMDSCCRQGKDGCCADWYESNSVEAPASCHKCPHFDHELYEIKLKEYKDMVDSDKY